MQQRTQTLANRFDIAKLTLTLNSPPFALPPLSPPIVLLLLGKARRRIGGMLTSPTRPTFQGSGGALCCAQATLFLDFGYARKGLVPRMLVTVASDQEGVGIWQGFDCLKQGVEGAGRHVEDHKGCASTMICHVLYREKAEARADCLSRFAHLWRH